MSYLLIFISSKIRINHFIFLEVLLVELNSPKDQKRTLYEIQDLFNQPDSNISILLDYSFF